MINKHPDEKFLVEYTSGTLPLAPCIAVTSHLQFCNTCASKVETLNHIGGELLEASTPVPVSEGLLEDVLADIANVPPQVAADLNTADKAVDSIGDALPKYVRQFLPEGNLTWKFLSPSLRVATVSVGEDAHEVAFHRIKAGGKAPEHRHTGQEITVVLSGSFSDEDGVYNPGDFVVREQSDVHRPYAAQNEECICLSVLAAPIKLTGLKRLVNPFLSFSPS